MENILDKRKLKRNKLIDYFIKNDTRMIRFKSYAELGRILSCSRQAIHSNLKSNYIFQTKKNGTKYLILTDEKYLKSYKNILDKTLL